MALLPTVYNIETGEWEEVNPTSNDTEEQDWLKYREQQAPPTLYNRQTGTSQEVTPAFAASIGVPIGPPRSSGETRGDVDAGYPNIPSPADKESSYWDVPITSNTPTGRKPLMQASTGRGVPQGYPTETGADFEDDYDEAEKQAKEAQAPAKEEEGGVAYRGGGTPGVPQGMTLDRAIPGVPQGMDLDHPENIKQQEPSTTYNGEFYPRIAQQRARMVQEVDNNPALREYLAAAMSQESGTREGILGSVEALFNRTQQRNSRISHELTNGFYGPVNKGYVDRIVKAGVQPWMYKQLDDALDAVRNGSDLIEGRTDQGGIDEIHGPKTKYGDEYFGYMDGDPTWSIQHQRNKGRPGAASVASRLVPLGGGDRQVPGVPQGMTLDNQPGVPQGMQLTRGIDAAIADAKEAGLTVTSGYRGPNDPLTRANPQSAHSQGRAFDLRAKTTAEADEVMAKQREIFDKKGMREGKDYRFIDEVRHPSGHATGPHVHVQLSENAMSRYMSDVKPEGAEGQRGVPGVPEGLVLDKQPQTGAQAPTSPEVTSQQLPSGEMAPVATEAQKAAVEAQGGDAEAVSRQMIASQNRERLQSEIKKVEAAGYKTPHFIGTDAEPEGDRAPTMDMENLAKSLRKQSKHAALKGDMETAARAGKEAKYWEDKVQTEGMSAEQWKKGTGEDFPHGPLPRVTPDVARSLNLDRWIDQRSGAEVRKAQLPEAGYTGPLKPKFTQGPKPKGLVEEGNLDIRNRKILHNPDGTISTESSMSNEENGKEVLVPTVINGVRYSAKDAWEHYKKTGEHLGKFKDVASANAYAEKLHNRPMPKGAEEVPEPGDRELTKTELDFATSDKTPQYDKETGDYIPEWQRPLGKSSLRTGQNEWIDASNSFMRGASSDGGMLSLAEGAYDIVRRTTKDIPALKFIHDNAQKERDATSAMRERVRKNLPVDEDFAKSYAGQITSGLGQLTNLPVYVGAAAIGGAPGAAIAGGVMTVAQLWQEGKDDYKQTMQEKGLPYNEADADKAATQYVAVAAPLEMLADYTIVGKFLHNSVAKKLTWGQLIKEGGKTFLSEGSTEGLQQAWLNYVANTGTKYDPERQAGKDVWDSFVVGGAVGHVAGTTTTLIEHMGEKEPFKSEVPGEKKEEKPKGPAMTATPTQVTQTANGRINELREKRDGTPPEVTGMDADGRPVYGGVGKVGRPLLKHEEDELKFLEDNIDKPEVIAEKYDIGLKEEPKPTAVITPTTGITPTYELQPSAEGGKDKQITKNLVEVLPSGNKVVVNHYDNDGKKTSKRFESRAEAKEHATKVAGDNNLVGFVDEHDDWTTLPEKGAPVEPTVETTTKPGSRVTDKDGKRGEVTGEKDGNLDVEWDDDTTSTVKEGDVKRSTSTTTKQKNTVNIATFGDGVAIEHWDDKGERADQQQWTSGTPQERMDAAKAKAEKIAKDNNLAGYYDHTGKFVRIGEEPKAKGEETTVTKPTAPEPAAAPGEWQGPEAQPGEPGLPQHMQEAFLKAQAKQAAATQHPNHVEINNVRRDGAYMMDKHGNVFSVRDTASGRSEDYVTHDNYSKENLGMPLRDAMREGWIRVITDKSFNHVQWDGRDANNAQLRALKDIGAVTGHEVQRERPEFSIANRLAHIERATGIKGLVRKLGAKITGKKSPSDILKEHEKKWKGTSERDSESYFRNTGYHTKIEDAFKTLGTPINYVSSAENGGAPAAINTHREEDTSDQSMDISGADWIPMIEATREVGGDKAADRLFDYILSEEVGHAADNKAANEEYDNLPLSEKKKLTFRGNTYGGRKNARTQFKRERYTAIIKEIRSIAQSAPDKDSRAITQLLVNSWNTYKVAYWVGNKAEGKAQRAGGFFGHPNDIFKHLLNPDTDLINDRGWQAIPEFIRQAKQMRDTGDISEATHAHIHDKIGRLFKKILNGLKKALKDILGTGKLPALEKILDDMDAVLRGDPVTNRQSSVQSVRYGTKEFNDFVGTTTITIGPDGKHQALYAAGAPAFNGLGLRFNPEKIARRISDQNIAQGNKSGYAMMAVYVRTEHPAMIDLPKGGNWDADNVAAALVAAGHLTPQDVAAITAKNGALSNPGIKEALQDKGFDSIAFKRGGEPTVIVFDNSQVASATGNEGVHHIDDLVQTKDPNAPAFESEIVRLHNTNGGSSYNAVFGDMAGKDQYAVGSFPELSISIKGDQITRQDIIDIRDRAMAEGIDLNTKHIVIGTWYNKDTGWTDIDISAMISDLHSAFEIAQEHQQTAIFDLATMEAIPTNGAFPMLGGLPSLSERNGFIAAKAAQPITFIKGENELTVIAKENEQYKNWYDRFAKYMRDDFLKDYPEYIPLINYFLGATSPNNLVAANFTRMVTALRNFVETGDPGISKEGKMFMESHYKNLRRSVKLDPETGKPVDEFENISGLKVSEYTPALFGDPSAMAIDMHVANLLFGTNNPTDAQREEAMRMIMRIAKRLKWTYAEVQAAFFAADLVASKVDPETGKIIPGKKVDHYERTAELRRAEVYKLLDADRKAGGLGAKISASLLERTRQRVGVERLLGSDTRAKQQILRAREVAINEYVANNISLRGPPQKTGAKGIPGSATTPSGTATTDHDRRVSNAPGNWFYNGIKHVFWNSPGLSELGNLVHKHIDLRRKLAGEYLYPIARWAGSLASFRPSIKQAVNQHAEWREAKAKGMPTPTLSQQAKNLKGIIDGLIAKVNQRSATSGVKIRNPAGKWVPLPHIEYPHIIQQKYMDAMRNPNKYQSAWNELVDNMKSEGILPKTATEHDARVHVQNFLRKYDSNGAFGSFFFHNKMIPHVAHDYSLGAVQEFLQRWIDKTSLAESFGPNPDSDIFEFAKEHMTDKSHKDYITRVKSLAYGTTVNDLFGRVSSFVGGWASIQHLANWITATKDLISGQIFNMAILGPRNYITGFWNAATHPFETINEGSEQGIILGDITKIMTDGEMIGGVREVVGKVSMAAAFRGFVETWNRGIAYQGGKSLLRHAIYAYKKNPRSSKTLNYMSYMQRLGFREGRAELLLQEGGKGELAAEYLRSQVNAIQAGYTYADLPAFASEPAGKFWLKYSPWSLEHTRLFFDSVLGPDARNVGLLKKDKVPVIDPATGKKTIVEVPRRPLTANKLMWYLFLTTAGGAGEEWLLEQMFRIRPKTARWSEIWDRFRRDDPRKYNELALKLYQINMVVGTFGALGNYIQSGLMATGIVEGGARGGLENLSKSIPALDPALKVYDAAKKMFEQGAITGRSLEELANAVSGYRVAAQTASNLANDVFGTDYWYAKLVSQRQDLARIHSIQDRWMKDIGKAKAPEMLGMLRMEQTEKDQWRGQLHDALSIGDLDWAKKIVAEVKASMPAARWKIEAENLKQSIKQRQPIKGSEVAHSEFNRWAKATLPPEDIELIRRANDTYRNTAKRLPLGIEFKPPELADVMKFRAEIKAKNQEQTYPWSPFKF